MVGRAQQKSFVPTSYCQFAPVSFRHDCKQFYAMITLPILFLVVAFFSGGLLGISAGDVDSYGNYVDEVHRRSVRQIAPGTKWCGKGDKAANDEDLGFFRETDACCREHDKCSMNIAGHETKFGLTNPDKSTRSHCDCDKKFFECLTKASSRMSRTIGEIYFNFLSKKCFRKKELPDGKTGQEEYEWVDGTAWLPTKDELKRMYRLMALLNPELEIDPSEDDIID